MAGLLLLLAFLSFLAALGVFGPGGRTRLASTGLYLAGSAGAFVLGVRTARARRLGSAALAALIAGGAVRLALAWVAPPTWDLDSYQIVVQAVRHGDIVYEVTDRYNYSPVWWHVLSATDAAARAAHVRPVFGFRVVAMLGDALVALALLFHGRGTATRRRGTARAALWWVNPVPIAVSAFGAQFDALAIGIFILALAVAVRGRSRGATLAPALLVGAAVALKQIVVAFVAAFLGFSRGWGIRLRDAILAAGPFPPPRRPLRSRPSRARLPERDPVCQPSRPLGVVLPPGAVRGRAPVPAGLRLVCRPPPRKRPRLPHGSPGRQRPPREPRRDARLLRPLPGVRIPDAPLAARLLTGPARGGSGDSLLRSSAWRSGPRSSA